MNRILLVEDHPRLTALLVKALGAAGIAADAVDRSDAAWAATGQFEYAALVLDRGLPDGDGLALLRRLRAAGVHLPCLVLTARDALHDRIDGLESGADDYLPKPFAMDELVARVRALLRRPAGNWQNPVASFGDLRLLADAGQMACGEERTMLAPAELQFMLLLMQRGGDTVRRSALEAAGWGLAEAVTPNAFDVALHRLRRKLAAIGSTLEIVNSRGHGYALRQTALDR
jgi:DNA-binding response OmpR family regulator